MVSFYLDCYVFIFDITVEVEGPSSVEVVNPVNPPPTRVREMTVVREQPTNNSSFQERKKKLQCYHKVFLLHHVPAGNTRYQKLRKFAIAFHSHKTRNHLMRPRFPLRRNSH